MADAKENPRILRIDPIKELLTTNVRMGLMSPRVAWELQAMVDWMRKRACKDG